MYTFFSSISNPIVLFWLLLVASFILSFRKKERHAHRVLVAAIFWMFIISTSPFSQWVVSTLEDKFSAYQPKDLRERPVYILVLGGGHTIAPELPPGSQLTSSAMLRLSEGIRLYRQIPGSKLVCSGYSVSKRTTQAEMLADAAVDLGVAAQDTLQNRYPENTAEEIRAYKNRFGKKTTLIIVTSALHMPRAMMLSAREGLTAIPAPTDFYCKNDPLKSSFDFYPNTLKIVMLESALHEYGGILKATIFD